MELFSYEGVGTSSSWLIDMNYVSFAPQCVYFNHMHALLCNKHKTVNRKSIWVHSVILLSMNPNLFELDHSFYSD